MLVLRVALSVHMPAALALDLSSAAAEEPCEYKRFSPVCVKATMWLCHDMQGSWHIVIGIDAP